MTYHVVGRTQQDIWQLVEPLLVKYKVPDTVIEYCKEDTGNNPHIHFYFHSTIQHTSIRQHRPKYNIPPGQKALTIKPLLDGSVNLHNYRLYMCKGYNVSSKNLIGFVSDSNEYIGEPPQTFNIPNWEDKHTQFWDNFVKGFKDKANKPYKVSEAKTGAQRFIEYLQSKNVDNILQDTGESPEHRYEVLVNFIVTNCYHFCRNMCKSSVPHAVKNLASIAINHFDNTGLYVKVESHCVSEEFLTRVSRLRY